MATIKIKSGDQWTQIPMIGINPIEDAPSDGKTYGRKNKAWSEVSTLTTLEDGGNGTVIKEIKPNVYYQFGECDSLTITLAEGTTGYLDEYMFEFSCPLFTATNFSDIEGIIWANNKKLVPKNDYKYQVSIKNNIASYIETQLSASILTYKTTGASESVQLIYKQEYAKKITLEDGTDVPITGTRALNYTFADAGNHKVAIELKEDVTDFSNCFSGCTSLTSMPETLFASNTAITDFSFCFANCTGLISIPDNLFANNTAVTDFGYCFYTCTGLTSIPENLFASNTKVTDFRYCFLGCTSLTSIPENLFASNTAVTNFNRCFSECSGLTGSIPENLFASNTAVTNFGGCFASCTGLTSIPENLFANNTAVTDFYACFNYCRGLTGSIPENLFANNTAVTDFGDCFMNCSELTGNVPVDNDGTPIYNRSGNGKEGYAIVTSSSNCFYNCTKLTGYNSIPSDWR